MHPNPLPLCGCLMLLLSVVAANLVENQASGLEQAPSLLFGGHRLRTYQQGENRIVQPPISLHPDAASRVRRDPLGRGYFLLVPLQIVHSVSLPTTPGTQWHLLTVRRFDVELREAACPTKCARVTVSAEWRKDDTPVVRFRCDTHQDCRRILQALRFRDERSRSLRASLKFTFYGVANGAQYALTRIGLPVANAVDRPFRDAFWFEGDKLLLFTIKASIGLSAYDTYQAAQSYPISRDGSLPPVYRSGLLDDLATVAAAAKWEIVAEMRKDGRAVAQAVFSAEPAGLTRDSWFSPERLLSSKPFWVGNTGFNFFSIAGHVVGDVRRRFFINRHYGGCHVDVGLFTVSDATSGECPWAQQFYKGAAPTLIYSAFDDQPYQSASGKSADNFLIYMRLARPTAQPAVHLPGAFQFEPHKVLLFTVAAKSNQAAADAFLNSDIKHPVPTGGLPDMYRSELIDSLGSIYGRTGMKFVVAEMRAGSQVVSQVVFDISVRRTQINKENWFARDRVVSSFPYHVGDSFNFFSIRGHEGPNWKRSFFISFNYGGCGADRAFWVVSERVDPCAWANRNWNGRVPVLIYTKRRDGPPLEGGAAQYDADRFLVYLK